MQSEHVLIEKKIRFWLHVTNSKITEHASIERKYPWDKYHWLLNLRNAIWKLLITCSAWYFLSPLRTHSSLLARNYNTNAISQMWTSQQWENKTSLLSPQSFTSCFIHPEAFPENSVTIPRTNSSGAFYFIQCFGVFPWQPSAPARWLNRSSNLIIRSELKIFPKRF